MGQDEVGKQGCTGVRGQVLLLGHIHTSQAKHSHSLVRNPATGTQRAGRLPWESQLVTPPWTHQPEGLCLEQVVGRPGLHSQDPEAWSCWWRGVSSAGLLWPVPVELGSRSVAAVPGAA